MNKTNSKNNWKKELAESFTSLKEVSKSINVPRELFEAEKTYPILVSEYYKTLIDPKLGINDPIWKQCIPSIKEIADNSSSEDPLSEEKQMPVNRLIHRYKDRAVILVTSRCTTYCRFCFRKRYWKNENNLKDITDKEIEKIVEYLHANIQIKDILISGGDPLTLTNKKVYKLLLKLTAVKSLETLRIATRVPVTMPSRIDKELVKILSQFNGLWMVTHFNHPNEITKESMSACKKIISSGIPILNQTVLLKGVNDDEIILENLFRELAKNRIKPHYLFHVDPIKGAKHFATGTKKGLEIMKYFRTSLSSIATPTFAIDLPEGCGKVSLQPSYETENGFLSINGDKTVKYYGSEI